MKVIISKYFKLLTFDDSSPIFEKISRIWRQRVISSFSPTLQLFKNHFKANQNKQTNKQILVALKVFQNILKPKWKERKKERKKLDCCLRIIGKQTNKLGCGCGETFSGFFETNTKRSKQTLESLETCVGTNIRLSSWIFRWDKLQRIWSLN